MNQKNAYEISATSSIETADFNLFVSQTEDYPSLKAHDWYSVELGENSLQLSTNEEAMFLFICVANDSSNSISCILDVKISKGGDTDEPMEEVLDHIDEVQCVNCRVWIGKSKIPLHSAFCERKNAFCEICEKVLLKTDFAEHWHCTDCPDSKVHLALFNIQIARHVSGKDKHLRMIHTHIDCDCGLQFPLPEYSIHKRMDCTESVVECRFCHLLRKVYNHILTFYIKKRGALSSSAKDLILGSGLNEHESECGARTIDCFQCGKAIQLKDVSHHMSGHKHQKIFKDRQKPTFTGCPNAACSNHLPTQKNTLSLCQSCFNPFWSSRDDPGLKKLQQRIVEQVHKQLTIGCDFTSCSNEVSLYNI